jgi:hypothetical protein
MNEDRDGAHHATKTDDLKTPDLLSGVTTYGCVAKKPQYP